MSEPGFTRIADTQPAFPIRGAVADYQFGGMTLRDYFAAKAMQGFIACPDTDNLMADELSQWAYKIADAMLKARQS